MLRTLLLLLLCASGLRAEEEERLPGWLGEQARPSLLLRGGDGALGGAASQRGRLASSATPALGTVHPQPQHIEQLSWSPRAYLYRGFMSAAECQHFVTLATPSMAKSTVVDVSTGKSVDSQIRTSFGTFLRRGQDEVVEDVERRIAEWSMVPAEHGEGVQILRYDRGQKYEAHYDFFHDSFNADPAKGGQRVATVLMYLSDVEEGGETVFPSSSTKPEYGREWSDCARRGLAVKPRRGDALLFFSLDLSQQLDTASLHAGCPVVQGTKWSATKWMHVLPFMAEAPRRKGCQDYHHMCSSWAKSGECTKNGAYMTGSDGSQGECRKSCKTCTPKAGED